VGVKSCTKHCSVFKAEDVIT